MFTYNAPEHVGNIAQYFVYIHHLRGQYLAAAESEQLPRKGYSSLHRGQYLLRIFELRIPGRKVIAYKFRVAFYGGQNIIKVMRNPAGQHPHRFHFLRLKKLILYLRMDDVSRHHIRGCFYKLLLIFRKRPLLFKVEVEHS